MAADARAEPAVPDTTRKEWMDMAELVSPDTALRLVRAAATALAPTRVAIEDALGLRLCEPVRSDRPYPPFDRAMMDGFAVALADAGRVATVVGEVAAGEASTACVSPGSAVRIMTGAACPQGTEAVVPVERVHETSEGVTVPEDIRRGQNVAAMGSECPEGATVAQAGDAVTPLVVASLAMFGSTRVSVIPRPACAVITTGGELVDHRTEPDERQIRNSNGPMLAALLRAAGVPNAERVHADDTPESLSAALDRTAFADIIVLTGGVSAGKYDLVPAAVRARGFETVFHKVAQRPGKPLLFARRGHRLLFGLPGNPLASHLGFERYVRAAIDCMMGGSGEPAAAWGELSAEVVADRSRTLFQLCRAVPGDVGWNVTPLIGRGSADLHTPATANAMVRVEPMQGTIAAGARVPFTWLLGAP